MIDLHRHSAFCQTAHVFGQLGGSHCRFGLTSCRFTEAKFPEEAKKAAQKLPSEPAAYALKLLEAQQCSRERPMG